MLKALLGVGTHYGARVRSCASMRAASVRACTPAPSWVGD